jgi:hypothetical protein
MIGSPKNLHGEPARKRSAPATLTVYARARIGTPRRTSFTRVDSPAMALFGKKRRLTACAESGG